MRLHLILLRCWMSEIPWINAFFDENLVVELMKVWTIQSAQLNLLKFI